MRDDIVDVEPNKRAESLRTVSWISYFLHLIVAVGAVVPGAQPSLVLLFVALALDLVKRSDARGTWQESHFDWRIRSVIWASVWYVVTCWGFLFGLFLFNPLWVIVSIWFLYRIVRGMLAMSKGQAINA